MTPIWGMSQRLPRRVGTATAKRLMFTADIIDANEAVRIGLAEYNVPLEGFEQEIESLADRIVANSCFPHAENKRLLDASEGLTLSAGLQRENHECPDGGPALLGRIARFTRQGQEREELYCTGRARWRDKGY